MGSDVTKNSIRILPVPGPVNPDAILEAAKNADLTEVVVIGWDENGGMFFSSSATKLKEIDWLLSNAKIELDDWQRRG